MSFEEYFYLQTKGQGKFFYSYLGIKKKDYPKWNGWTYIEKIRKQNIPIGEVCDPFLEKLVYNFYLILFLNDFLFGDDFDLNEN